jgi:hypothetical protein
LLGSLLLGATAGYWAAVVRGGFTTRALSAPATWWWLRFGATCAVVGLLSGWGLHSLSAPGSATPAGDPSTLLPLLMALGLAWLLLTLLMGAVVGTPQRRASTPA